MIYHYQVFTILILKLEMFILMMELGELFRYVNAGHGGWDGLELSLGLGVESVLLARSSVHPQEDAGLAAGPLYSRLGDGLEPRHGDPRKQACGGESEKVASLEEWMIVHDDSAYENEFASVDQHPKHLVAGDDEIR